MISEVQELASMSELLSSVVLGNGRDKWKWLGDSSGIFSVKSAKDFLVRGRGGPNGFVFDWCKWVPPKCNIFAWRLELNRLPTYDALLSRGIVHLGSACPLCGCEDESVTHLFISCRFADLIWLKVSRWCRVPPIFAFSGRDLLELHKFSRLGSSERLAFHGIVITTCWCIWLARNKAVFSASRPNVETVFSEIRALGFFWFKNRSRFQSIGWRDWCKFVIM
ncbi:putative reverse transcriptase zinc-binding domain-containing protein [Helianthus annuus]|nr:putative reverse transcriptase zinc-binding domain-containing protein [Helianthus annuus]